MCPDTEESDYINLSFRLTAMRHGGSSRVDEFHEEISSEYAEFEDRIYADKFAFYIYAGTGASESLLMKLIDMSVENMATTNDPHTSLSGGPTNFTLKVSVSRADFEAAVPSAETEGDINFRIVVFANTDTENTVKKLTTTQEASFSSLINAASDWTYNILGTLYADPTTDGELLSNAAIPMYGIRNFTVSRSVLYKSKPYAPVDGGPISLLRSIAKIKVIDNIQNRKEGTENPRITSVKFTSSTSFAYVLPYGAAIYENSNQVTMPNPCESPSDQHTTIILLKQDDNSWIGYVPELNITNDIQFTIKIKVSDSESEDFVIPMTGYRDHKFEFGTDILRNHIYTLSVEHVGVDADIRVKVENWEPKYHVFDFTDNVAMAEDGALSLTEGTYASLDRETGRVIFNDYPQAIEGSFGLSEPKGAQWYAYLVTKSGELNVIQFVVDDEKGNTTTSSTIGGIIDPNKKIKFKVRPTQSPASSQTRSAVLQVIVVTDGGLSVPVNILKDTGYGDGIENITFVQNPQN